MNNTDIVKGFAAGGEHIWFIADKLMLPGFPKLHKFLLNIAA